MRNDQQMKKVKVLSICILILTCSIQNALFGIVCNFYLTNTFNPHTVVKPKLPQHSSSLDIVSESQQLSQDEKLPVAEGE